MTANGQASHLVNMVGIDPFYRFLPCADHLR